MLFKMDRMRDLRSVILKTLEGSRLVSETLEMFIAGVLASALILTMRGGTEERDLIGCYFRLLLTVYCKIGYINGAVAFVGLVSNW